MKISRLLVGSVMFSIAVGAWAEVIDVSVGGDIAAAVAAAKEGDVVQLAAGTHVLAAELKIEKAITVKGAGRFFTSVVSDGGVHRLFYLSNPSAVLSDLTVSGATATASGAGVYLNTGVLCDAIVCNCTASAHGAGVFANQNGVVSRCVLTGNVGTGSAYGGGIYVNSSNVTIGNTLVSGNTALWGGGCYVQSGGKPKIVNCTFANNTATATDGGADFYNWNSEPSNCSFVNTIIGVFAGKAYVSTASYDSKTDPKYVSAPNDVFRLAADSPFLAAGKPVEQTLDLDSNPIPATPAIGCFQPLSDPCLSVDRTMVFKGESVDVHVTFPEGVSGGEGTLTIVGSDLSRQSFTVTDGETKTCPIAAAGMCSLVLDVVKGGETVRTEMVNAFKVGIGNVYYNPKSAAPTFPYDTPETGAHDLQTVVSSVLAGGTVWVVEGEYAVSTPFVLARGVTIRGVNRNAVVFKGGKNRIFSLAHAEAKLSNLTIRGCGDQVGLGGLGVFFDVGGGTAEDCLIENCVSSSSGAAVTTSGDGGAGTLRRCIVRNCTSSGSSSYAGAVFIPAKGRVDMFDCLFTGNRASGNWGSAVYNDGLGSMVNCTLFNNPVATVANGEFCRNFAAFGVTNCILGSVSWYRGGNADQANNLGGATALADPGFRDAANGDYRLSASAAAVIDQGRDDVIEEGAKDLSLAVRIQGEHVDIGCYEFAATEFTVGFALETVPQVVGDTLKLVPSISGSSNPQNTWTVENMANGRVVTRASTGSGAAGAVELAMDEAGFFNVTLMSVDGEKNGSLTLSKAFSVRTTGDIFVATTGTPVSPYDTPETATTNLVAAVHMAGQGATVQLGEGTFLTDERLVLPAGVQVVGAGIGKTLVKPSDDESATGLFLMTNKTSSVRQLMMTAVLAKLYADGDGGAVRIEAGALVDCCVKDVIMSGGQVNGTAIAAIGENATISRVTVHGCRGGKWGTVVLNHAKATMANCLVYDCEVNGAVSSGYTPYGCCVYIDQSGGSVSNCTLVGTQPNAAYNYCPIFGKFVNCVLDCSSDNSFTKYYKDPKTGEQVSEPYIGTNNFIHCASSAGNPIIDGRMVENDNQSEVDLGLSDPANDDYHLTASSPCLRSGLYEPWMRQTRDLDNRRRTSHETIDLGCYQFHDYGLKVFVR